MNCWRKRHAHVCLLCVPLVLVAVSVRCRCVVLSAAPPVLLGAADHSASLDIPSLSKSYVHLALSLPLKQPQQGTKSSKRKKQAKLKRVMSSLKKHARREAAAGNEGFAALHLLHDPQVRFRFCWGLRCGCLSGLKESKFSTASAPHLLLCAVVLALWCASNTLKPCHT